MWGKSELDQLAANHFPQLNFDHVTPMQMVDIARFMILFIHGGVFADLDCIPQKSLDFILGSNGFDPLSHRLLLTEEYMLDQSDWEATKVHPLYAPTGKIRQRIANWFIYASHNKHPMLYEALLLQQKRLSEMVKRESQYCTQENGEYTGAEGHFRLRLCGIFSSDEATIYATGPDIITEVLLRQEDGLSELDIPGAIKAHPDVLVMRSRANHLDHFGAASWRQETSHIPSWKLKVLRGFKEALGWLKLGISMNQASFQAGALQAFNAALEVFVTLRNWEGKKVAEHTVFIDKRFKGLRYTIHQIALQQEQFRPLLNHVAMGEDGGKGRGNMGMDKMGNKGQQQKKRNKKLKKKRVDL